MGKESDEEATRVIEDFFEHLSFLTPAGKNGEVVAKAWCDSRNVEYVSHHMDEEGMLHITCRSSKPLTYITIEGTIDV